MPTVARAKNPLRVDPTRTATIRRQFASEIKKRFARLVQRIRELIVTEDAFGLRATRNERFRFLSDSAKVEAFRVWIAQQIAEGVIPATKPLDGDPEAYWDAYIQAGYRQGAGRAFEDVRPHLTGSLDFHAGTREEFLRTAFAQPVAAEKVKLLAARTFADLKNVTDQMAVQLGRVLADGLTQGQSPRDVARNLARQVEMSESRALTVARTETIRAHAEGQLDSLEKLGVEELGVMVEWSTAGDGRVCERCAPLEGIVIKTAEARGLLPRHPNCRCAFLPAGLGEDTSGQKKSHAQVRKAIDKSIAAELPKTKKRTLAEQKKLTSWLGADKRIDKKRPKSILDGTETKIPKKPKTVKKKAAKKTATKKPPAKPNKPVVKKPEPPKGIQKGMTLEQIQQIYDGKRHADVRKDVLDFINNNKVERKGFTYQSLANPEDMISVELGGIEHVFPEQMAGGIADDFILRVLPYRRTPKILHEANQRIVYSIQANKDDAYWAVQYNKPGFVSVATGGDGTICVYHGSGLDTGTYTHESGHNLATKLWGSTHPDPNSEYGLAQKVEAPVSDYAKNGPNEDFADACKMYVIYHDKLKEQFPKKYEALKKIFGD